MFKKEYSPLVETDTKDNRKCKLIRYLSMVVLCIVGAALLYYSLISGSSSNAQSSNNLFLNANSAKPEWYPKQEVIDEYRSKKVFIQYDAEDAPDTDDFDSDEMRIFHNNLIKKHGYNLNDHIASFIVMDPDIPDQSAQNPLACGTMYTLNDEAGFMELNCGDFFQSRVQYKVTGCVSYEADTDGLRKGERGIYNYLTCIITI